MWKYCGDRDVWRNSCSVRRGGGDDGSKRSKVWGKCKGLWGRGGREIDFVYGVGHQGGRGNTVLIYTSYALCDTSHLRRESSRLMSHFLNSGVFV